jgi:hypothetical protein
LQMEKRVLGLFRFHHSGSSGILLLWMSAWHAKILTPRGFDETYATVY